MIYHYNNVKMTQRLFLLRVNKSNSRSAERPFFTAVDEDRFGFAEDSAPKEADIPPKTFGDSETLVPDLKCAIDLGDVAKLERLAHQGVVLVSLKLGA